MAQRFAGVLGMLAFAAILVRGVAAGGAWDSTIGAAVTYLFVFAVVGGIAGWMAERTVDDAIRGTLAAELNQQSSSTGSKSAAVGRK